MHRKNIIHRDLKLANILLHFPFKSKSKCNFLLEENVIVEQVFVVKLADFGFSREYNGMIQSYCGTPINMAPEVLEKRLYNYKADLLSLGVVLFELITGEPPFNADNKKELKLNIKKGVYKLPKFYKISENCLDFVHNCL